MGTCEHNWTTLGLRNHRLGLYSLIFIQAPLPSFYRTVFKSGRWDICSSRLILRVGSYSYSGVGSHSGVGLHSVVDALIL